MEVADQRARWKRRRVVFLALAPAALAAVLLALAAGASRDRWLPVAGFLALAVVADAYFWVSLQAERRRAVRLRQAEVALGVRHDAPLWMATNELSLLVEMGAVICAIPAAFGLPSVGVGVLLVFLGAAAVMSVVKIRTSPRGLTFEAGGLRLHIGGGSFVVPWTAIAGIDRIGPDHVQMVQLRLTDADEVIASHEPKSEQLRARVASLVGERGRGGGRLMLWPGTGGLDGPTIARTIEAAQRGHADRAN